jgi:HNH endonuclease
LWGRCRTWFWCGSRARSGCRRRAGTWLVRRDGSGLIRLGVLSDALAASDAVAAVRLGGKLFVREAPKASSRRSRLLRRCPETILVACVRWEGGNLRVAFSNQRFVKHLPTLGVDVGEQAKTETLVDAILNEFGSIDEFIHDVLGGPRGGTGATRVFYPVTQRDIEELDSANGLNRNDVGRESTIIRGRLAEQPRLKEGLDPQTRQTRGRARRAAFAIDVKRLYGYRCAICESELRTPDGKPEVQSAHIFSKGLDGSDDARNGLCLCRRPHWGLDAGWISIDDEYKILVREDLPDHEDYRFIRGYEGERIHLPAVPQAVPDVLYLREHRKLTGFD